jgi:hypothetical protein
MLSEPIRVVATIAGVFDSLAIPYLIGGSVASSVYGVPRATQDVDLVADIRSNHVNALTGMLAGEFYVDADMIREALQRRSSFNVVHLATMFKADVFILQADSWAREEMKRARTEALDLPEGRTLLRFASPEDILLHKLVWYKLGNQISDRQWNDVLGILKIQGEHLDQAYLDLWAPLLDVFALLQRARNEGRGAK